VSMLGFREQEKFRALYNRRAAGCSYGEKRWFVFLTLISTDADVYILDEPTAGVDPEYSAYMLRTLIQLGEKGKSVLISTHQISDINNYCDYFYFLKNGTAKRFRNAAEFAETNGAKSLEEAFIKYVTTNID
jgi:ABC-2 type transport system ATP-binding protein